MPRRVPGRAESSGCRSKSIRRWWCGSAPTARSASSARPPPRPALPKSPGATWPRSTIVWSPGVWSPGVWSPGAWSPGRRSRTVMPGVATPGVVRMARRPRRCRCRPRRCAPGARCAGCSAGRRSACQTMCAHRWRPRPACNAIRGWRRRGPCARRSSARGSRPPPRRPTAPPPGRPNRPFRWTHSPAGPGRGTCCSRSGRRGGRAIMSTSSPRSAGGMVWRSPCSSTTSFRYASRNGATPIWWRSSPAGCKASCPSATR